MNLPGNGVTVRMVTGDPVANWVGETDSIPVSKGAQDKKTISAYKMGVIIPWSYEYMRDDATMYNKLVERIPGAFAKKFDATVFGVEEKPSWATNFDQLKECPGVDLKADPWQGLITADAMVAENNAILNGYCISPKAKSMLLGAVDGNKRPLFVNNVTENSVPVVLGNPTYVSRGAYKKGGVGTPETVGFAGDWNRAYYGMVENMRFSIATQGEIKVSEDETINLFQDDMIALRFVIEVGFAVQDTKDFVRLTGETPSE
jgi:HK97 family phage major capsid protein